jgi:hypothetical protein
MQCSRCNAALTPEEQFCGDCGEPAPVPANAPFTPPVAAPRVGRSGVLLLVVGVVLLTAVVTGLALYFLGGRSTGDAPASIASGGNNQASQETIAAGDNDPLLARLINTELPQGSIPEGWKINSKELNPDKDTDEGEVGEVYADLGRSTGGGLGALYLIVYKTPAQASTIYKEDTSPEPALPTGIDVTNPLGLTATCWGRGGQVHKCEALTGRTIVTFILLNDGELESKVTASVQVLVQHLSALSENR